MSCSLVFAGDIAPIRQAGDDLFGELAPVIRGADLAVANLEIALTDREIPTRGKIYPHKGTPASIHGLKEAGFDAFNLANNHMLDFQAEALLDTLKILAGAGVTHFGAGRDAAEAAAPVILERAGLKIGLLGVTTTLPQGFAAGDDMPGVNPLRVLTSYRQFRNPDEYPGTAPIIETAPVAEDLDRLVGGIRDLRGNVDTVLVYAHWGTSMTETVHDFQRTIGHAAIDAGADAVLGGHQHVVSGVEFYRGRPIVHGMGNLLFDFAPSFFTEATRRTVVFRATLTGNGLVDCGLICCRTGVNRPVVPLRTDQGEGQEIFATVKRLSEPLSCAVETDGERIVLRQRQM